MLNKPEFSDVVFMVEGKKFYGHKIIISLLSEKFKAMFSGQTGFIESQQNTINISNVSYTIFNQIMAYLYTGIFDLGPVIQKCLDDH